MLSRRTLLRAAAVAGAGLAGRTGEAAGARAAGFFLPDEARRHERTFLQWPANPKVHGVKSQRRLQAAVARLANTIVDFEPVVMLAGAEHHAAIRAQVTDAVTLWDISTDDLWCRDSGPAFVIDGQGGLGVAQFNFNGWGGKQVHGHDGKIAARVADRVGLPVFDAGLVGEPGGVETDGAGTLIAHASSWIDPNRNPGPRAEVEAMLLETLGARKVIWAPGIAGEDITDYHIDALARFVAPGRVVIQTGAQIDRDDPWSVAAAETREILATSTDAEGRRLTLVDLREPDFARLRVQDDDFVASYVNFYVCNGGVIAAQFGDTDADAEAARVLAELYPDREVVMLEVDALGQAGGGIHCATHEQPVA